MLFTTPEDRRMTEAVGPKTAGDRCFLHYRRMMQDWKKSRRWTTADQLGLLLFPQMDEDKRAEFLAFLVFFIRHVMVYENEKAAVNGEVE